MQVVLIGIDADAELAAVLGGLKDAHAGGTCGRIDDIDAAVELTLGEFGAAAGIVPGGRRRPGHVGDQFGIGIGILDALFEAALELADQRDVHAAHEADLSALGSERRQNADQEGAFVFPEHHRLHVGQVDDAVDDGEADLGKVLGDLLQGHRLGETDGDDRILAALGEPPQRLLELRLVAGLEFGDSDRAFLLEFLGAGAHALVEGFVELSARAVDNGRPDLGLRAQWRQHAHRNQGDCRSQPALHGRSLAFLDCPAKCGPARFAGLGADGPAPERHAPC